MLVPKQVLKMAVPLAIPTWWPGPACAGLWPGEKGRLLSNKQKSKLSAPQNLRADFLLVRKATISIICLQWSTTSCKRFLINPNSLQENQSPQANSQAVLAHTPTLTTTCLLKLVRLFLPDAVVYTLERQQADCIPSELSFYPQTGLVWWFQWAFTFRKFIRVLRKTMSLCRKIEEREKRGERR